MNVLNGGPRYFGIKNLGKRHISILSMRNVIWTLGEGVAPVTFLGKSRVKV